MLGFLEWMGLFYLASMATMAASVAIDSSRTWVTNVARAHEHRLLLQAYPASKYYDTVSTRRWQ